MPTCDGTFEPKSTAPPNWIITPENLYNGKLLDVFAGVYAAAELRKQTQPGTQNQEYSTRKNQWLDFLNKLKLPPSQNTHIIDLGLTPDLCSQGRPPTPPTPALDPDSLINGSVGNSVAELLKQQLFDQYCECKPRNRQAETCPCQFYKITFVSYFRDAPPPGQYLSEYYAYGRIGAVERRPSMSDGRPSTNIGWMIEVDCPAGNPGTFHVSTYAQGDNQDLYEVVILSIDKAPGNPVIDCTPVPPPPPSPPYVPGLPPGYDIALPPELPQTPPATWKSPGWFIPFSTPFGTPTFPPPPLTCDYMYWDKKYMPSSELYSDLPPSSGLVVYGTADTVDFDILFDPAAAIADKTLRSWRKRTEPIDVDTTFINAAQVYLMIDGVVLDDGVQMNVPKIRLSVPFEYRDRQKSIKIMAKGIQTPFRVLDSGTRWISKKFPTP